MYDAIVVGGGPAGITAGIYLVRANKKVVVFEKEAVGGQIASSPLVNNFPGFPSISGSDLANTFYEQAAALGLPLAIEEVQEIIPGKPITVKTDMCEYQTKTVVIATGSKFRLIGLPNEANLIGKGISFCTSCDGAFFKGKDVAIVGGANTAVTNALYMANLCNKVYVIYRKDKLRGEPILVDNLLKKDNVEVIYKANVKEIIGTDSLEKIILDVDGTTRELEVKGLFPSIGMDAETEVVKGVLNLNESNYVVSEDCSTNVEGIFVAGDCRTKEVRQLTTAVSDGTIAATSAIKYLETYK